MFENICVGIMVTIVVVAAVWSWWVDNHGDAPDTDSKNENKNL